MFSGILSITEVPSDLTPAALPDDLSPDVVITVQPGEMIFTAPAPLTMPNRAGWPPGTVMDLWSINPESGAFDKVGTGKVSADGTVIVTTSGGIINSSWHFFTPPPPVPSNSDSNNDTFNLNGDCPDDDIACSGFTSGVELHSGAVIEIHELVTYNSLGRTRGVRLVYDSLRADPRPIVHFGMENVSAGGFLTAMLSVGRGDFFRTAEGYEDGGLSQFIVQRQFVLNDAVRLGLGEHVFSIPQGNSSPRASLQIDMRGADSGVYRSQISIGLKRPSFLRNITDLLGVPFGRLHTMTGSRFTIQGTLVHVEGSDSAFGVGWGLDGLQRLVENPDGSVLLINGNGTELVFQASEEEEGSYVSPEGDFTLFEKMPDDTFLRVSKDGTIFLFDEENRLSTVMDRNNNATTYAYDAESRLVSITDPVGLQTQFAYDALTGLLAMVTDPADRVTLFEHDVDGNLTQVTDPDSTVRRWQYDASHHLVAEIDKRGFREEAEYDFAGRAVRAIRKDGSLLEVQPVQTLHLLPISESVPYDQNISPQIVTLRSLQNAAEPFADEDPVAEFADGNGNTVMHILDGVGQIVGAADEVGPLPFEVRNEQNLIVARTDGEGNTTLFEYDERGNIVRITDAISTEAFQWSGAVSGNWNDATKWIGGVVPGPTDDVVIIGEIGRDFTITISDPVSVQSLIFGGTGSETLELRSDLAVEEGLLLNEYGQMTLDGSTITGDILIDGILTVRGTNQVNGFVEVGSQGTLRVAAANSNGARLTVSDGLTNDGSLILDIDTTSGFQTDASLTVTTGILLNRGTIQSLNSGRGGKSRTITAVLQNEGIIRLNYPLTLTNAGRTFTSTDGTIDLVGSNALDLLGGQTILGANTVFPGTGTLRFRSQSGEPTLDILGDITLTDGGTKFDFFHSVTVNGPGSLTIGGNVALTLNSDTFGADLDLIVHGMLLVNGRNIFVNGGFTLPDGGLLRLAATGSNGAHITFANGFTNEGEIILDIDTTSGFQTDASLNITEGTLVNKGTIESLNTGGGGKTRTINAVLQNEGIIRANYALNLNNSDRIFTTTDGTIDLVGSHVFEIFGRQTILGANTVFPGTGTLRFRSKSGEPILDILGDITLTDGGTKFDFFDSVTVNGPGSLTIGKDVALTLNSDTFGADLDLIVHGMLLVNDRNIFVNGGFSLSDGSLLRLAATGSRGAHMTIANGFTNEGEIIFDIDTTSGFQTDASLAVTNGTLVNKGTIQSLNTGGGGKSRTLSAALDNQGQLLADYTLTLSGSAANHVNSGTVLVNAFLRIQSHSSFTNQSGGVIEFSGNNTLDINNGSFLNTSGGILRGFGIMDVSGASGGVLTNDGLLQPGGVADTNAFSVIGSYLQSATGKLEIELLDPDTGPSDQLKISGTATLGGELAIAPIAGTTIVFDDTFPVLTYASSPTPFDSITGLDSVGGLTLDPVYNATELTLTAVAAQSQASMHDGSLLTQTEFATTMKMMSDASYQTKNDKDSKLRDVPNAPIFDVQQAQVIPDTVPSASESRIVAIDSATGFVYADNPVSMASESSDADPAVEYEPVPTYQEMSAPPGEDFLPLLSSAQLDVPTQVGRRFTYEPNFNRLTSITDELGRPTIYEVDPANGNILTITRIVGEPDSESAETDDFVTSFTYASHGQIDTITDPQGRISDFDYDLFGRLTARTFAVGTADEATESYELDAAGNVAAIIDANGNRTEYGYDLLNRMIRVVEPDPDGGGSQTSPVTLFTYDENGNLTTITNARDHTTILVYDALDRLAKFVDADTNETVLSYDDADNLTSVLDPLLRKTARTYDARNRLIEILDPDNGSTQFAYDFNDNLVALVDPVENQTGYGYDARDRTIAEMDPLGAVMGFEYNAVDNLIAQTDRNGRKVTYAYDDLDRLLSETWIADDQSVVNVVQYTYDTSGNLLSAADNFSALSFSYDDRDRVAAVDNTGTPNAPETLLNYSYDEVGNVLSLEETIGGQEGATTVWNYDPLNRPFSLTQSGPGVAEKRVDLGYNELGQITSMIRSANLLGAPLLVDTRTTYDGLNRVDTIEHRDFENALLSEVDLDYDAARRPIRITTADGVSDYSYDTMDQLIAADHSDPANPDESYTYGPNGNRTNSHRHGSGYSTGDANRLFSDGSFDYAYDGEGNLIRRSEIATGDFRELTWDHRNRLTAVIDKDSGDNELQRVEFTYDALNRRISKTVQVGVNETTTHFVYDREDVILDFVDDDGTAGPNGPVLDRRYLHGPEIDQVLAQEDASGNIVWHLADHLGTVHDLVGGNSTIVNHISYDSYGNVISQTDSAVRTRYRFTGREFDAETGLHYYRARYYDASIGKFLSEDPINRSEGANLYTYVANNPVSFLDPTGLEKCSIKTLQFAEGGQGTPVLLLLATICEEDEDPEDEEEPPEPTVVSIYVPPSTVLGGVIGGKVWKWFVKDILGIEYQGNKGKEGCGNAVGVRG